jgi:oligopeptide transport system ATP-binding protein
MLRLISMPPGKICGGKALFRGRDLLTLPPEELRKVRGSQIGVVFQDPMTSFNQVMTIGDQLIEGPMEHLGIGRKAALELAAEFLGIVGIPRPGDRLRDYPHQFSGGMRQRAMIALALMCRPALLIADEPTTALDVTVQAQILDMVKDLRMRLGTSIIWISHDLGVVAGIADSVLVMYAGFVVEDSPVDDLYANPLHPYTRGLLDSLPSLDGSPGSRLKSIGGMPPYMSAPPVGCPFRPRCPRASEPCGRENPALRPGRAGSVADGHLVACWMEP